MLINYKDSSIHMKHMKILSRIRFTALCKDIKTEFASKLLPTSQNICYCILVRLTVARPCCCLGVYI